MLALDIQHLNKHYDDGTEALRNVTLQVDQGGFFALLGPNGAGKTTLIRILTGLLGHTSGSAHVMGLNLWTQPLEARFKIGLVPQEFNFNMFFTIEQVLVNFAGYFGVKRPEAKQRAEQVLKMMGLWEKRDKPGRELSGGMKRRVMIARALMHKPEILILDEPTAGVDLELRRLIWSILREVNAQGTTIVLTTHYLEEAEALCDQLAIIDRGSVVAQGPMADLLRGMDHETLTVEVVESIDAQANLMLPEGARWRHQNATTLEIDLSPKLVLKDVVMAMHDQGLTVRRVQNKVNRLEELFLHVTGDAS